MALARSSESAWTTCANEMRKRTIVIPQLETGDMRQVDGQITFQFFSHLILHFTLEKYTPSCHPMTKTVIPFGI